MKLIQVQKHGGPEELQFTDAPTPQPAAGQAVVHVAATGVNFIDVYFRTGLYKADLPLTPGSEAAGTVESVGEGVTNVKPGDRVAWAMVRGSYTQYAAVPAAMLQGMTAHYLTHSTFALKKGDTALVHAAAGGAGGLIVQMAKMLGATVIGTAGSDEKAAIAKQAGADEVIVYTRQDFVAETKRITGGRGVDVIYDSVGKTTFLPGLDVICPRGMMVLFGQSSGAVAPFDPGILNGKGSLYVTRPSLAHYASDRKELEWRSGDVLNWIAQGKLKLRIDRTYPLAQAADAHRDLEGRKTAGKLILLP
jgi:NADPH2:quinone reductase